MRENGVRFSTRILSSILVFALMFSFIPAITPSASAAGVVQGTATEVSSGGKGGAALDSTISSVRNPSFRISLSRDKEHSWDGSATGRQSWIVQNLTKQPAPADNNYLIFNTCDETNIMRNAKNTPANWGIGYYDSSSFAMYYDSTDSAHNRIVNMTRANYNTTAPVPTASNIMKDLLKNAGYTYGNKPLSDLANFNWASILWSTETLIPSLNMMAYIFENKSSTNASFEIDKRLNEMVSPYLKGTDNLEGLTPAELYDVQLGYTALLMSFYRICKGQLLEDVAGAYGDAINTYVSGYGLVQKPVSLVIDVCIPMQFWDRNNSVYQYLEIPATDFIMYATYVGGQMADYDMSSPIYESTPDKGTADRILQSAQKSIDTYGHRQDSNKQALRISDYSSYSSNGYWNALQFPVPKMTDNRIFTANATAKWVYPGSFGGGFMSVLNFAGTVDGFIISSLNVQPLSTTPYWQVNEPSVFTDTTIKLSGDEGPDSVAMGVVKNPSQLSLGLRPNSETAAIWAAKDGVTNIKIEYEIFREREDTDMNNAWVGDIREAKKSIATGTADKTKEQIVTALKNGDPGFILYTDDETCVTGTRELSPDSETAIKYTYWVDMKIKYTQNGVETTEEYKSDDIVGRNIKDEPLNRVVHTFKAYTPPPDKDDDNGGGDEPKPDDGEYKDPDPVCFSQHSFNNQASTFAEIKSNTPNSEEWEAMAGIPSTETLYFSAGGTEYIVSLILEYWKDEKSVPRTYRSYFSGTPCEYKTADSSDTKTTPAPEGAASYTTTYNVHTGQLTVTASWSGKDPGSCTRAPSCSGGDSCSRTSANSDKAYAQATKWLATLGNPTQNNSAYTSGSDKLERTAAFTYSAPSKTLGSKHTASSHSQGTSGKPPKPYHNDSTGSPCDFSYSVTATATIVAHSTCGPCCTHDLPLIEDTWTQQVNYDYVRISQVRLFQIDNAKISSSTGNGDLIELTGQSEITAQIVRGDPSVFMNIAQWSSKSDSNKNMRDERDTYAAYYNREDSQTSLAGRLRYSLEPKQHDVVVWNEGVRTNTCNGMGTTKTGNTKPMLITGHDTTKPWAKGDLYTNAAYTNIYDFHMKKADTDLQKNIGNLSDAIDIATPEWKKFDERRRSPNQVTVISDFLILQTSGGDQSIFYFDKNSYASTDASKRIGGSWGYVEEDGQIKKVVGKGDKGGGVIEAQAQFGKVAVDQTEIFDNNANTIFLQHPVFNEKGIPKGSRGDSGSTKYKVGDKAIVSWVNQGGYNGHFDKAGTSEATNKKMWGYNAVTDTYLPPAGNGGVEVATCLDNDPAETVKRPARSGRMYMYTDGIQIKPTVRNSLYSISKSSVFYKQVFAYYAMDKLVDLPSNVYWGKEMGSQSAQNLVKWGYDSGLEFATSYAYDKIGAPINDVIVYTPVSTEYAVVNATTDVSDQRTDASLANRVDMNEVVNAKKVCPLDPATCEFRVLNCKYGSAVTLAEFDFETLKNDKVINKTTGNSYSLPSGFTVQSGGVVGEGQYLTANGTRWSIPLDDLGLRADSNATVRVEMDVYVPAGSGNTMLVSFYGYGFQVPLSGNGYGRFTVGSNYKQVNYNLLNQKLKLTMDFNFNRVSDSQFYINGVQYTNVTNAGTAISVVDKIGPSLNIGSWGTNASYPAKFSFDNLKISKLGSSLTHTDSCYKITEIHDKGYYHEHTAVCKATGNEYACNNLPLNAGVVWDCGQTEGAGNTQTLVKDISGGVASTSGSYVDYTLTPGVYKIAVSGGAGGPTHSSFMGGNGGYASGNLTVTSNTTVRIYVGGGGQGYGTNSWWTNQGLGGWNGGGNPGNDTDGNDNRVNEMGGGGGGGTIVTYTNGTVLIAAGGGGGATYTNQGGYGNFGGGGGGSYSSRGSSGGAFPGFSTKIGGDAGSVTSSGRQGGSGGTGYVSTALTSRSTSVGGGVTSTANGGNNGYCKIYKTGHAHSTGTCAYHYTTHTHVAGCPRVPAGEYICNNKPINKVSDNNVHVHTLACLDGLEDRLEEILDGGTTTTTHGPLTANSFTNSRYIASGNGWNAADILVGANNIYVPYQHLNNVAVYTKNADGTIGTFLRTVNWVNDDSLIDSISVSYSSVPTAYAMYYKNGETHLMGMSRNGALAYDWVINASHQAVSRTQVSAPRQFGYYGRGVWDGNDQIVFFDGTGNGGTKYITTYTISTKTFSSVKAVTAWQNHYSSYTGSAGYVDTVNNHLYISMGYNENHSNVLDVYDINTGAFVKAITKTELNNAGVRYNGAQIGTYGTLTVNPTQPQVAWLTGWDLAGIQELKTNVTTTTTSGGKVFDGWGEYFGEATPGAEEIIGDGYPLIHTWKGWTAANMLGFGNASLGTMSASGGNLVFKANTSTTRDRNVQVPVEFDANAVKMIKVYFSTSGSATDTFNMQMYYQTALAGFSESQVYTQGGNASSGGNQVFTINTGKSANWKGTIKRLRFDFDLPANQTITISKIEVYGKGAVSEGGAGGEAVGTVRNYAYTGSQQSVTLQPGSYKLEVWGAQGGGGGGGLGGYSVGAITIDSAKTAYIYVGENGKPQAGGWNGGGGISTGSDYGGGGGTDIRIGSNSLSSRVIVAGGGGGAQNDRGGVGGGTSGTAGTGSGSGYTPGQGGTQSSGGSAGTGSGFASSAGTLGNGGYGFGNWGGGGGGGYYGGGGGVHWGGGGGSGYIGGVKTVNDVVAKTVAGNSPFPAPSGGNETGHTGNGYARITTLSSSVLKIVYDSNSGGTVTADSRDYVYKGYVETFVAPRTGDFTLEVWGGEGGSGYSSSKGGAGGYSKGTVHLTKGETLYVAVGGRGKPDSGTGYSSSSAGGWNGGGNGNGAAGAWGGGGGGATHIAKATGTLASLSGNRNSVLIVAGGGGGGGHSTNAGGGGGLSGIAGTSGAAVGTQSSGNAFGQGGSSSGHDMGAGGGGWFGAAASTTSDQSAGGGSGYIGGVSGGTTLAAQNTGDGKAKISWSGPDYDVDKLKDYIIENQDKIPNRLPDGTINPIWGCGLMPFNKHVCNEGCRTLKSLQCTEPHHFGLHYDGSNRICWDACGIDENHHNTKEEVVLPDGTVVRNAKYLVLDHEFSITFPNLGDFQGDNRLGLRANQINRGLGYSNKMDTTQWTREKRVRFPFNVISKMDMKMYTAFEWIELPVDEVNFDFYMVVANNEAANASVEFEVEAINCNVQDSGVTAYDNDIKTDYANALKKYFDTVKKAWNTVEGQAWPGLEGGTTFLNTKYNAENTLRSSMKSVGKKILEDYKRINEAAKPLTSNDNKLYQSNRMRTDDMTSLHGGYKSFYIDVIGRIGNFAMVDTEDYRFSNFFKNPVEPTEWLIDGFVKIVDVATQNNYVGDLVDMRGNKATETTHWLNTYGTQTWMQGHGGDVTNPNLVENYLVGDINNIPQLTNQQLRFGYNMLTSIQTTGNYSAGQLQIVPYYWALNTKTQLIEPVDVYISKDGIYEPINLYDNVRDGKVVNPILENILNLDWEDECVRRMYTLDEQFTTEHLFQQLRIENDDGIYPITVPVGRYNDLGTSQFMLLSGRHRTFIGSTTTYGNEEEQERWGTSFNPGGRIQQEFYMKQVQRWHFKVGVPSSSVFVPTGIEPDEDTIQILMGKDYVLLCTMSVVAVGTVWSLEYSQPWLTGITIGGKHYNFPANFPPLIGVTTIDKPSVDDLDVVKVY